MTSTADGGEGAYFRSIEESFVALRGAPFLLSPEDYRTARDWYRREVPLSLVREALAEVFAKRRLRGDIERINSLRYCARAVEAAFRQRLELSGPPRRPASRSDQAELQRRLRRLAAALPETLGERAVWAGRILALVGDAGQVEDALSILDRELVDEFLAGLEKGEREDLESSARDELAGVLGRVSADEREAAVARWLRNAVRRAAGLPVLSLFHP